MTFFFLKQYFWYHWSVIDTAQIYNLLLEVGAWSMSAEDTQAKIGELKTTLALYSKHYFWH